MTNRAKPAVAVALSWDGATTPRVTAKGRGELAEHIAELAREHDVPIDDDPELVELLARVEIGDVIPQTLFTAVAEVIAFAYAVRGLHLPREPGPASRDKLSPHHE